MRDVIRRLIDDYFPDEPWFVRLAFPSDDGRYWELQRIVDDPATYLIFEIDEDAYLEFVRGCM